MWQASNTNGYFAVTGHWIEEVVPGQWEIKSSHLGFTTSLQVGQQSSGSCHACAARCLSHAVTRRASGICKPGSIGDRAIGCTTDPFRECLHPHQSRASRQSHCRDPVHHRRHRTRHGARRRRANNSSSSSCAPRLSTEGGKWRGGSGHVVFRDLFRASRRVAHCHR